MNSFYKKYLLPGLVFQGIVIGGGYATGRELAEFFMPHGFLGGLLSMLVAALVWCLVMAVSFEICRKTKEYDYKSFFKLLLGRYWFLYEILYLFLILIVLSVIGAATGEIVQNIFAIPTTIGVVGLFIVTGIFTFYGSVVIERFMGSWSILLYTCFFLLVVLSFVYFGEDIKTNYKEAVIASGWFTDGIRYAGYNVASVPAVFFSLHHITKRREAISAGIIAGITAIIPAVFLFIAMMGQYPEINQAAVPSTVLLSSIGLPWFSILFQMVLLGTLVQTGVGLIHAINERIAVTLKSKNKKMPKLARPAIAILILLIALLLATKFGLIQLIAKGYGILTIGFIAVFVIPVLTIGPYKIIVQSRENNKKLIQTNENN